LITMGALLFALDWLVRELECYCLLRRADSVCDEIDYLESTAFLDEIRQSPEYRSIRSR